MSIDFETLNNHLKINHIIKYGDTDYIARNKMLPDDLKLRYIDRTIDYNIVPEEPFSMGPTFEFVKIKFNDNVAYICYLYYPRLIYLYSNENYLLKEIERPYYQVNLWFEKTDDWIISDYKIKDLKIEMLTEWQKQNYKRLDKNVLQHKNKNH